RAEAGGEGGLWLGDAPFRSGDLCGVPGQEVVHRLLRREAGDRRKHAEGIRGEEHHVLRVTAASARNVIAYEVQRVRRTRVLRDGLILELHGARLIVQYHVLEDRSEHLRGPVDVGLPLRREVDHLRVATALEVEHTLRTPAVLVITDEEALRIG